jgi:hypothetical protein
MPYMANWRRGARCREYFLGELLFRKYFCRKYFLGLQKDRRAYYSIGGSNNKFFKPRAQLRTLLFLCGILHRLKYQRFGVGSSVPSILKNDSSSCLCVSDKILALGTHDGHVHLLDLNGNEVSHIPSADAHLALLPALPVVPAVYKAYTRANIYRYIIRWVEIRPGSHTKNRRKTDWKQTS